MFLKVPWCSIVGDHDVHEKSFANFLRFMASQTHYRFTVGSVEFFALNAFDVPDPGSFYPALGSTGLAGRGPEVSRPQ